MNLHRMQIQTPLGPMILAANATALAGLWFENQQHLPLFESWSEVDAHPILNQARAEIEAYFEGRCNTFLTPRVALWGTVFQRGVWDSLMNIQFGQTTTYGAIAQLLNKPQAVRAVGGAVGRNPWSIMIPCHRVVGADGSLTGYAGGLDRKIALLRLEGAIP